MTVGNTLKWLWKNIIASMPVKVFIVAVISSIFTLGISYKFYYAKKIEKASGTSVAEVEELRDNWIQAQNNLKQREKEIDKTLKNFEHTLNGIRLNTKEMTTKVDIIYDLVVGNK